MLIRKRSFLFFILMILPYTLYAWGDGDKLSDGSCKFDKETGYIDSSLYLKDNEAFLIVDGGDSRYGTTSTVYNALTCEKVTSGDKTKSDFSGVMERKGFIQTNLKLNKNIDKSFQHKITFLENSYEIMVHIEPIESSVTKELKTILASISDKSASSQIAISDSAKEFFSYIQFYSAFVKILNNLSVMEINYNYALSLNNKFQINNINTKYSKDSILSKQKEAKRIILAKQEEAKRIILAKQEEERKRLAKIEKEKKKRAIEYHEKMVKQNLMAFAKHYGISKYIYKNRISWRPDNEWDYHSNVHTITGKGKIWFNPNDSTLDDVYIKGEFRNNRLVSNANLRIDASICLLKGIFSCRKRKNASESKTVTAQNLATSIASLSSIVRDKVYDKAYGGFNQKKSVGQRVCMSRNQLLWRVDIVAYVESVSGDRIQLRISDTGSDSPIYNGTTLRQGTIIWDDYYNWEPC